MRRYLNLEQRYPGYKRANGWPGLVIVACAVLAAGCNNPSASTSATGDEEKTHQENVSSKQPPPTTAKAIMQRMIAAYQQAEGYVDQGVVRYSQSRGNDPPETEEFACSVAFKRPAKVAIVNRQPYTEINMVSDGNRLYASVFDQRQQSNFDNQVFVVNLQDERRAAAKGRLRMAEDIERDEIAAMFLYGQFGPPLAASALIGEQPFADEMAAAERAVLLEPALIEGHACHRVQIADERGKRTFWIDTQSFVLRRFEFPVDRESAEIPEDVTITLTAEMRGARFTTDIDESEFQFKVPRGAKLVRRFVPPPPPAPPGPAAVLGEKLEDFSLLTLDGKRVSRNVLAGKVAVLDFWFQGCPPCRQSMPLLEKVYRKYKDHERVVFFTVNIDPATITNSQLKDTHKQWGVDLPIVRDLQDEHTRVFFVQYFPTLLLVGADGIVHEHSAGLHEDLAETLPGKIEKLLAGKDLVTDVLARFNVERRKYENVLKEYQSRLELVHPDNPAPLQDDAAKEQIIQLPAVEIAGPSEPRRLKRTQLWKCGGLRQPGNLLVVPGNAGDNRVFVVDGYAAVAELDATGNVAATYDLKLPEMTIVTYLRTGVDGEGHRYFVAAASGQRQLYVYDENWTQKFVFPPDDYKSEQITDVRLADLDADGTLELYVAYLQNVGVQQVSLAGQRTRDWGGRDVRDVHFLAAGPARAGGGRQLLCATARQSIVPLDHQGTAGQAIPATFGSLVKLVTATLDGQPHMAGIAFDATGGIVAVGIASDGAAQWQYPLDKSSPGTAVEQLTGGNAVVGDASQWLIAGADGTVHLLAANGTPFDRFAQGTALDGLAAARLGGKPTLLVASGGAVIAYRLEAPASDP